MLDSCPDRGSSGRACGALAAGGGSCGGEGERNDGVVGGGAGGVVGFWVSAVLGGKGSIGPVAVPSREPMYPVRRSPAPTASPLASAVPSTTLPRRAFRAAAAKLRSRAPTHRRFGACPP